MTDRTTPQEASRAAFEAWVGSQGFDIDSAEGEYYDNTTWRLWNSWQAATASRDAEVLALRDALIKASDFLDTVHDGEYGYSECTRDEMVEQIDAILKEPK